MLGTVFDGHFKDIVKYELFTFFRNLCDSCISMRMLLLILCVPSLGLGLDLANSLDHREGEHARAHSRAQSFWKKATANS